MCTMTCRTATWDRCRCECDHKYHGEDVMTALTPPVPRRSRPTRERGRDMGAGAVPDLGSPLFGVDLLHIETWLDDHPALRDEVRDLVLLATPSGPRDAGSHDACSVLVGVVIAMERVESLRDEVVGTLADAMTGVAMAAIGRVTGSADDDVLEPLVSAVINHVVDAVFPEVALCDPEVLMAVRLAAILACPDTDEHPDVVEHCLRPLAIMFLENDDLA